MLRAALTISGALSWDKKTIFVPGEALKMRAAAARPLSLGSPMSSTIGNYLREFEIINPSGVLDKNKGKVPSVVEELRKFLMAEYAKSVIPLLEQTKKVPFAQIPDTERPGVGLVVAGFSPAAFLPEVWNIWIPVHDKPNSAILSIKAGMLGSSWFSSFTPIFRYIKGRDPQLLSTLILEFEKIHGSALTDPQKKQLETAAAQSEYQIVFAAMPLKRGIEYVRFLVQLVISHYKFAVGAPIVGGSPRIGVVTYKGGEFKILDEGVENA